MMPGRVQGKVALITGAARGQGRAHAIRLAQEGADIIAIDICGPIANVSYPAATKEDLATTVKAVEAHGRRVVSSIVDVRDGVGLRIAATECVDELGKLDIVVANAGICIVAPWEQTTSEIFKEVVDINLIGTWNTVLATAPHVVRSGGGSIVLVSSVAGLKGLPFQAAYVASKHGVTGLAKALSHELAKDRVRVNSLHPTGVRTAMSDGELRNQINAAIENNPRLGGMYTNSLDVEVTEPEDQANAVLFLASDESRYVTGLAMTVDAGASQY